MRCLVSLNSTKREHNAEVRSPFSQRKTFSDAIASAVPVYLQTQQQLRQQEMMNQRMAMQQEQFERSLAERTQARLDQAEKANQAQAYKAQKELEKTYKERTSEIYGFDTSNLNESQAAVIKVLVQDGMQHLGDNEVGWQQALNNVEEYIDLFTATESDLEEREATFSQYALEGKDYADPTMEFIGDEFKMNQYRSVRNLGGIDISTIDLVNGVPVAEYLGPDGEKLIDEQTKTIMSGPIKDAPYYNPANRSALYSIDGNLVERSNVSPADFLIGFEEQLAVINSDTTLTADQKRDKVKQLLLSGFEDRENLSDEFKLGYSSAIRAYDQSRLNKNKPMQPSEIDEAVNSYIDKVVDLYQPERSLIETELDYNNYFEQRLSKIANEINRRDDLTRDEKIDLFVERSNNVFRTGSDDLDKRARATAEDVWKSNNTGANYDESAAFSGYMKNVLERADVIFEEQREETAQAARVPTQTEQRIARNKQTILSAASNIAPISDFPALDQAPSLQTIGFDVNSVEGSSISLSEFKKSLQISDYLPDSFSTGEPQRVAKTGADGKVEGFEMVPGPRLNVEAKPTVMKILDTDRGPVLELGGWTGVKNAASTKVQIPPIYIELGGVSRVGPFMQSLNAGIQEAYGVTLSELLNTFTKNRGGL